MRTVARCWKSASTRPSVTVGEQLVLRDQDREFDRPAVDRLAYRFQFLQLLCDAVYHRTDAANEQFDRAQFGAIGGATIAVGQSNGRPIGYRPVPEGTPRWGADWKS